MKLFSTSYKVVSRFHKPGHGDMTDIDVVEVGFLRSMADAYIAVRNDLKRQYGSSIKNIDIEFIKL